MASHDIRARPLRPGVSVWNPALGGMGTIGFFARRESSTVLVTCRHSARADQAGTPDVLRQPGDGEIVADVVASNRALDVAAASLRAGLLARNDALGIGPLRGIADPRVGLRVVKSGFETGVTEGVIECVDGSKVRIRPRKGLTDYVLSSAGDSGAAWITLRTREIVAVHTRGNTGGGEFSEGVAAPAVMAALSLDWL
jgi:hypothetical protein